jgi:hypothetical protein
MLVNGTLKMTRKDVIVDYLKYFQSNIGDTKENHKNLIHSNQYPDRQRSELKTSLTQSRIVTHGPTWNYFNDSQTGLHKSSTAGL